SSAATAVSKPAKKAKTDPSGVRASKSNAVYPGTAAKHQANAGSTSGNRRVNTTLAAAGLGFLVLMAAGVGLAVWEISDRSGESSPKDMPKQELLAANEKVTPESPG